MRAVGRACGQAGAQGGRAGGRAGKRQVSCRLAARPCAIVFLIGEGCACLARCASAAGRASGTQTRACACAQRATPRRVLPPAPGRQGPPVPPCSAAGCSAAPVVARRRRPDPPPQVGPLLLFLGPCLHLLACAPEPIGQSCTCLTWVRPPHPVPPGGRYTLARRSKAAEAAKNVLEGRPEGTRSRARFARAPRPPPRAEARRQNRPRPPARQAPPPDEGARESLAAEGPRRPGRAGPRAMTWRRAHAPPRPWAIPP